MSPLTPALVTAPGVARGVVSVFFWHFVRPQVSLRICDSGNDPRVRPATPAVCSVFERKFARVFDGQVRLSFDFRVSNESFAITVSAATVARHENHSRINCAGARTGPRVTPPHCGASDSLQRLNSHTGRAPELWSRVMRFCPDEPTGATVQSTYDSVMVSR